MDGILPTAYHFAIPIDVKERDGVVGLVLDRPQATVKADGAAVQRVGAGRFVDQRLVRHAVDGEPAIGNLQARGTRARRKVNHTYATRGHGATRGNTMDTKGH